MVNSMWPQAVPDLEFLSLDGLGWNDQALLGLACCNSSTHEGAGEPDNRTKEYFQTLGTASYVTYNIHKVQE